MQNENYEAVFTYFFSFKQWKMSETIFKIMPVVQNHLKSLFYLLGDKTVNHVNFMLTCPLKFDSDAILAL